MMALAATSALLFAGLYAVAVGSADGRYVDEQLRPTSLDATLDALAARIINGFSLIGAVATTSVLIVFALVRHGARTAVVLSVAIGGAVASARLLKALLGSADPLEGEMLRSLGSGFYPSGHATTIMALVLSAAVVAPTTRARQGVVLLGGSCAGAGGVLLLVDSHFASDIIAGYLLASMWFALAAAMVAAPAASAGPRAYARVGLATLFVVFVAVAACLVASVAGGAPFLGVIAIASSSITVVTALAIALGQPDRSLTVATRRDRREL